MEQGEDVARGPFRTETVRGEPYEIGGKRLIPEARIISFSKARANIGSDQTGGWAGGFVRVTPLAIVHQTAHGEQRIPIRNATAVALQGLLLGALAVTATFAAIRRFARRWRAGNAS